LLNLLSLMSDVNARSLSHIISCIFNLERYSHLCWILPYCILVCK
jgi:hypothetical protein